MSFACDASTEGASGRFPRQLTVDVHSHVVPRTFIEAARAEPESVGCRVEVVDGRDYLVHGNGLRYPIEEEFHNPTAKLTAMDRAGIDVAFLSPSPTLFYYWASPEVARCATRLINDGIAEIVAANPTRLRALGTVPLQDPRWAVSELQRVVAELKFSGIAIGTSVEGEQIAHPRFRAVLKRASELGVLVFAHPLWLDGRCGLGDYYLTNLIGNPLDTTIMAGHLMFSGALESLPDLKMCLAHGGGYLPYQIGRFRHGHAVRPETKASSVRSPVELLRRFHFDILLHDPLAVRHLIDRVGAERVLVGTDAPFDMGLTEPLDMLRQVPGLSAAEWNCICCGNALRLMVDLPGPDAPLPTSGQSFVGQTAATTKGVLLAD